MKRLYGTPALRPSIRKLPSGSVRAKPLLRTARLDGRGVHVLVGDAAALLAADAAGDHGFRAEGDRERVRALALRDRGVARFARVADLRDRNRVVARGEARRAGSGRPRPSSCAASSTAARRASAGARRTPLRPGDRLTFAPASGSVARGHDARDHGASAQGQREARARLAGLEAEVADRERLEVGVTREDSQRLGGREPPQRERAVVARQDRGGCARRGTAGSRRRRGPSPPREDAAGRPRPSRRRTRPGARGSRSASKPRRARPSASTSRSAARSPRSGSPTAGAGRTVNVPSGPERDPAAELSRVNVEDGARHRLARQGVDHASPGRRRRREDDLQGFAFGARQRHARDLPDAALPSVGEDGHAPRGERGDREASLRVRLGGGPGFAPVDADDRPGHRGRAVGRENDSGQWQAPGA